MANTKQFLKDLSYEFEFETLLVKISYWAYETPKTKKIESRPPLGSPIRVVQKKPGYLSLVAFLLSRNKKNKNQKVHKERRITKITKIIRVRAIEKFKI